MFKLEGCTVAITGAAGFIGRHLIRRCREKGCRIRGLDQTAPASDSAEFSDVEMFSGNICDAVAAERLCEGADLVFHTAAIVREGGKLDQFRKVNVEGTQTVAAAARAQGVKRFLQVSSVMVYGFDYPADVTEDGPLDGAGNSYCQTKIESEHAAFDFHDPGNFDVTAVRCGDVYGPGSQPWTVRPITLMKRRMFAHADGGRGVINHVYIDNLIDGFFLVAESDVMGEPFNISDGEVATFRDFFGRYATMLGKKWQPSLPAAFLKYSMIPTDLMNAVIRRDPLITREYLPYVLRKNRYSIEKARRVLGFEPKIGLDEGMLRIEAWGRETGLL